jgi:hypothetical protein
MIMIKEYKWNRKQYCKIEEAMTKSWLIDGLNIR